MAVILGAVACLPGREDDRPAQDLALRDERPASAPAPDTLAADLPLERPAARATPRGGRRVDAAAVVSTQEPPVVVFEVGAEPPRTPKGPSSPPPLPPESLIDRDPVAYLRALDLRIPVAGIAREALPPSNFDEGRGSRTHHAYDILAPRGTPVLSAVRGRVVKLHQSEAGGIMLYTFDERERFVIFYAHLDRYHSSMREGLELARGDTVGYVGTTGNAPPTAPHLHLGIMLMDEDRRWWKGTPIDPQPILARAPR